MKKLIIEIEPIPEWLDLLKHGIRSWDSDGNLVLDLSENWADVLVKRINRAISEIGLITNTEVQEEGGE